MISRILVPLDASERRFLAVRWAAALARRLHAEVVLLHVIGENPGPKEVLDGWDLLYDPALQKYFPDLSVKRLIVPGDPGRVILEQAARDRTDLIVMPTRGRGVVRGAVLGSLTARVLREAPCAVWTGTRPANGAQRPAPMRILCAVALAPQSEKVVRWAADMAKQLRGVLTIMHSEPQLRLPRVCRFEAEWRFDLGRLLREQLAQMQQKAGTEAAVALRDGKAAKAVAGVAAELGADLLVIGRSPVRVLGSLRTTAYGIVRAAPCPVLSV
ncbi:MAG: universal stress protein [Rhodospirillales bacterium]